MKAFNQLSQSSVYKEDDISVSLTVCGGTYCGGSEVLVVQYDDEVALAGAESDSSYDGFDIFRRRSEQSDADGFRVYENHSQDSRCKPLGDFCETISMKYGTGGNNMPIVTHCIGNGQSHMATHIIEEVCHTLNCMHDQNAVLIRTR